jgi:hypothetical protein
MRMSTTDRHRLYAVHGLARYTVKLAEPATRWNRRSPRPAQPRGSPSVASTKAVNSARDTGSPTSTATR